MICKTCKSTFEPIKTFSGLNQSKLCNECRFAAELTRRRIANLQRSNQSKKTPEIALKSKLKKINSGGRNSKTKLDTVFSIFIRQRDATNNGFGNCISCGKPVFWNHADNGHYIIRSNMTTRYDEVNCNLQCRHCNRFLEGNMSGYRKGLIKKYGESKVDELELKKFNQSKISKIEMELLIDHYLKINSKHNID